MTVICAEAPEYYVKTDVAGCEQSYISQSPEELSKQQACATPPCGPNQLALELHLRCLVQQQFQEEHSCSNCRLLRQRQQHHSAPLRPQPSQRPQRRTLQNKKLEKPSPMVAAVVLSRWSQILGSLTSTDLRDSVVTGDPKDIEDDSLPESFKSLGFLDQGSLALIRAFLITQIVPGSEFGEELRPDDQNEAETSDDEALLSDTELSSFAECFYAREGMLHIRDYLGKMQSDGGISWTTAPRPKQAFSPPTGQRSPALSHRSPKNSPSLNQRSPALSHRGPGRRSRGTEKTETPGLKPSEGSYRPQKPQSHEAEITRAVQQLLNMVVPENLKKIVERFEGIMICDRGDLELMISLIIRKVLEEPCYCETYADLVYSLRTRYPEFPPDAGTVCSITFAGVLIMAVQNECKGISTVLEGNDMSGAHMTDEQRRRGIANMKFIGHLFLRKLLSEENMSMVAMNSLAGTDEYRIECACQLIQVIGYTLDSTESGKYFLKKLSARLVWLRDATGEDGKRLLSSRLKYKIQDLLDLQQRGWEEKLLREQAKTIGEVHRDAEEEARCVGRGSAPARFPTRTISEPTYIRSTAEDAAMTSELNRGHLQAATHVGQDAALMSHTNSTISEPAYIMWTAGEPGLQIAVEHVVQPVQVAETLPQKAKSAGVTSCEDKTEGRVASSPQTHSSSHLAIEVNHRLLARFAQNRDSEILVREWCTDALTHKPHGPRSIGEDEHGSGVLAQLMVDIGLSTPKQELQEAYAEAIVILVSRGAVTWAAIGSAMSQLFRSLQTSPRLFIELLFARLLLHDDGKNFDPVVMKETRTGEDDAVLKDLLLSVLRKVRDWGGPDMARRAFGRRELSDALRTAGPFTRRELARFLRDQRITE